MSFDQLTYPLRAFYYSNTELSITLFAMLVIFSIYRPRQIVKALVVIAVVVLIIYIVNWVNKLISG